MCTKRLLKIVRKLVNLQLCIEQFEQFEQFEQMNYIEVNNVHRT